MTSPSPHLSGARSSAPTRTVLAVAGVAVLLNGALALFGDDDQGQSAQLRALFAPPGWFVGGVWVVLFALLGLVRWRLLRSGSAAGRRGAQWTVAFIVACALYPLYTLGLRSLIAGFVGDVGTAGFAVVVGLRVVRVDKLSAAVFALVMAWLCYATLAITAQLGWLPAWAARS